MATLMDGHASPDTIQHLTRETATLAAELQHPTASRQREAPQRLVERITIRRDGLCIALKPDPLGYTVFFDEADHQTENDDLVSGRMGSMWEIAAAEDVSERYVAQLLPLAFLKPELVEGCLDGTGDMSITGSELARGLTIPREWSQQSSRFSGL